MFWNKKSVEPKYTRQLMLNDKNGEWTVEYLDDDDFGHAALEVLRFRNNEGGFYPTREEIDNDLEFSLKKLDELYGPDKPENLPEKADADEDILALSNIFQRRSAETALREAYAQDLEFITDLETLLEQTKDHFDEGVPLTEYQSEMAVYLLDLRADYPGEDYDILDITNPEAIWTSDEEPKDTVYSAVS